MNVKEEDEIMNDEIFGPVLPIYNVETEDEAISFINSRFFKTLFFLAIFKFIFYLFYFISVFFLDLLKLYACTCFHPQKQLNIVLKS